MHAPNPATLTLPDVLTELDLLGPMPDASLLLTQPSGSAAKFDVDRARVGRNEDITLMDMSSQLLTDSVEQARNGAGENSMLDDLELDIDIGDDPIGGMGDGTSVEIGRDAPAARALEDDLISDLGFTKAGAADQDGDALMNDGPSLAFNDDAPMGFDFGVDDDFGLGAAGDGPLTAPTPGRPHRDSQSPLSSTGDGGRRAGGQGHGFDSTLFEPSHEEESVHQPQRARKRKVIQPDTDTVLHSGQIKEQQEDRSKILKPASFLPRDPMMLTLMAMQRNGGFVSSILGDGRAKGWAPELKGVLSLEVIRKSGELKRKRDSGIADMGEDEEASPNAGKQARLNLGEDDDAGLLDGGAALGGDTTLGAGGSIINLPGDDDEMPRLVDDDDEGAMSPAPNFDDTVAPLVHPADSGPVSLGTKHAVHLLRDRFGPAADSPAQQKKAHVLFQDLLPERSTSKTDATKMFFEVLVLATKDAVKVEQAEGQLGGPIRVRGKRGLWGAWAEEEAGGEIASQEVPASTAQVAVEA